MVEKAKQMGTLKTFQFSNGDKVSDTITGYEGIVTGIACYITGCDQYLVTAKSKDKSKDSERLWIDDGRLKLIKSKKINMKSVESQSGPGSDKPAPIK